MTQAPPSSNAPPGGPAGAPSITATTPGITAVDPKNPNPAPNPTPVEDDPLKLNPAPTPVVTEPSNTDVGDQGDPGLNIAADYFVNTLGLSIDSPEIVEAAKGNYSYLEAKIVQLGDKAKGADRFIKLARDAQERMGNSAKTKHEATVKIVHDVVGGAENWKAVQNFARSNLSEAVQAEASAVLSQGGLAAQAMAQHLLSLASGNTATTITGANAVADNAAANPLHGHAPLNAEQYKTERKKLLDKYGIKAADRTPEMAALNQRYLSSKK